METYPHLVSSQIPYILLYIYTVKQSDCQCNILNSQNTSRHWAGNIFANEQAVIKCSVRAKVKMLSVKNTVHFGFTHSS
jgi:hypothetical protein